MTSNTKLVITAGAHMEWRAILHYTRRHWGEAQQHVYDDIIWNAFQRIRDFPEIGRQISPGIRKHILPHHTIVYQYRDNTVTILRILNPRRRPR